MWFGEIYRTTSIFKYIFDMCYHNCMVYYYQQYTNPFCSINPYYSFFWLSRYSPWMTLHHDYPNIMQQRYM